MTCRPRRASAGPSTSKLRAFASSPGTHTTAGAPGGPSRYARTEPEGSCRSKEVVSIRDEAAMSSTGIGQDNAPRQVRSVAWPRLRNGMENHPSGDVLLAPDPALDRAWRPHPHQERVPLFADTRTRSAAGFAGAPPWAVGA